MALFDPTKFNYEQLAKLNNVPGQSLNMTNTAETIQSVQQMQPGANLGLTGASYVPPTEVPATGLNAPTPVVPPETPQNDFSAILKGVMAGLPAPVDTSANDAIQAKIMELSGGLDQSKNYADLSNQYGIADKQKILSEKTAQLNTLNAISLARQENIRKNTLNQPGVRADIGQAQYSAQSNDEERTRAISALELSSEIQLAQGNYQFAVDQVDKMVELKYKAQKDQISAWTQAYEMNRDQLNSQEKKRGDAQAFAQQLYLNQINQQASQEKEIKTNLLDAMQKYPSAGISLNDTLESAQNKIINSSQYKLEQAKTQLDMANTRSLIGDRIVSTSPGISPAGKPLTATQLTSKGYYDRLSNSNAVINQLESKFTGVASYVGQYLPNILKSDDRQKLEQAERDFVNAKLRQESGAAIAPSEFDSAVIQYFPQPGDSKAVLKQKAKNRQIVINSQGQQAGQVTTVNINDPLGIR